MLSITWDVTKVPVDTEIGVGGDDATLEDLLAHHGGEGVFGCVDVGLDQPRILGTLKVVCCLLSFIFIYTLKAFCVCAAGLFLITHSAAALGTFAQDKLLAGQ